MAGNWLWVALPDSTGLPDVIRVINRRLGKLVNALAELAGAVQATGTLPDGVVTPSVSGASTWLASSTGATNITTFKDGQPGQEFLLWATTANTTIVHSAAVGGIRMKGGANVTLTANETRRFATVDGTSWRET